MWSRAINVSIIIRVFRVWVVILALRPLSIRASMWKLQTSYSDNTVIAQCDPLETMATKRGWNDSRCVVASKRYLYAPIVPRQS